jgi:hypothetical protein
MIGIDEVREIARLEERIAENNRWLQAPEVNFHLDQSGNVNHVGVSNSSPAVNEAVSRGGITKFTSKSRKRMTEKVLRCRAFPRWWSTLTFPDVTFQALEEHGYSRNIEGFSRYAWDKWNDFTTRVQQEFPGIGFVCKREIEARKRGAYQGHDVPHFHVMWYIPGRFTHQQLAFMAVKVQHIWWKVAGQDDAKALQVATHRKSYEVLEDKIGKVAYYLCKYCSKLSKEIEIIDHETGEVRPAEVGRYWTTSNNLPLEEWENNPINLRDYVQLKRFMRRKLRAIARVKDKREGTSCQVRKVKKTRLYKLLRSNLVQSFSIHHPAKDLRRYLSLMRSVDHDPLVVPF